MCVLLLLWWWWWIIITFCTKADISWNTHSSSLLLRSGLVDHGVDHTPWSKLYNLPALLLALEAARMWHLHICQGIIHLTYTGHSNNFVFQVSFLPCWTLSTDHMQCLARKLARPCQALSKHMTGWNLRVRLLWLTGVESSILCTLKTPSDETISIKRCPTYIYILFIHAKEIT